jgi:hypothetical protein
MSLIIFQEFSIYKLFNKLSIRLMSQSNKETNSINQIITFSQFDMYINTFRILKKKKMMSYILCTNNLICILIHF